MPDSITTAAPDLSLVLGPDDSAYYVATCEPPKKGGRYVRATLHVVVHRRYGAWTHVYRVLQEEQPNRLLVHLDKVFEGDRVAEARRWALAAASGS
ncbi:MAG TPA: hypothetical protein VD978_12645 [Azospirillum sp.]|nr:hypothetical protein [Azospirillum sp.]